MTLLVFQLYGIKLNDEELKDKILLVKHRNDKATSEDVQELLSQGMYELTAICADKTKNPNHENYILNVIYASLNQDNRLTGQFCPSLSIGDLVLNLENQKWWMVRSVGFSLMDIYMEWGIMEETEFFKLTHVKCGFELPVPNIWLNRALNQRMRENSYCPKCKCLNLTNGEELWCKIQGEEL